MIFLWIPQKVHDFPQLTFGFVGSGNVFKGNVGVMAPVEARLASAKAKDARLTLGCLAAHPDHQPDQE
jgi:hypothetical protein